MKKSHLLLLLTGFTAFFGCQKDIPLLGEGQDAFRSKVFIRSITLHNFPEIDPVTTLPWDYGSVQTFDSDDSIGPDIYFNFYHKSEEGLEMMFKQLTHFVNVEPLSPDTPLVYYFTQPFQIFPEYIDTTFYLRVYDLDYADPVNDSTLIDSIPFTIGPDNSQPNPYITSISETGVRGSQMTLGLEWK
jgi:hypothetical protein